MSHCRYAYVLIAVILASICGCDAGPIAVVTLPASGKIALNGMPLAKGRVIFEPTGAGKEAYGEIQPDGSFTLTTFKDKDGAVPGTHRVYVDVPGKSALPKKYASPNTSQLEIEVKAGTSDYPIELK